MHGIADSSNTLALAAAAAAAAATAAASSDFATGSTPTAPLSTNTSPLTASAPLPPVTPPRLPVPDSNAVHASALAAGLPNAAITHNAATAAAAIDDAVMRSQPPPKLPGFAVASNEARSPGPQVVLSPSPPADERPHSSPYATTPQQSSFPHSGIGNNPWHALAAMSGAPTPSLEGPSSLSRGSPMLGRPFEQLNIGGSWSGANLTRSDGMSSPTDSPPHGASATSTNSTTPLPFSGVPGGPIARTQGGSSPIAMGALAQRRALKASGMGVNLKPSPHVLSSPLASSASASSSSSGGRSSLGSLSSGSTAVFGPTRLAALPARDVKDKLNASDSVLILDIRPPSSFRRSHIPNAHSIPVPSTLLRRPAFDTNKLLGMLGPATREAVAHWRNASDIIIVDQDSGTASESTILQGLASKFDREGYNGSLWFVSGGQTALEADGGVDMAVGDGEMEGTPAAGEDSAPLGIGRLSRIAFQQGSTRSSAPRSGSRLKHDKTDTMNLSSFKLGPHSSMSHTLRQPSRGSSATQRLRLQPANPFFDNIRQNLELSHGGITERIPLGLPESVTSRANELPPFLRNLVSMPDRDSQDVLAKQFYRIELGEQKRLQDVMDVLSKGSSHDPDARTSAADHTTRDPDEIARLMTDKGDNGYYPFSITAGVERGAKNRYKNIWPYDFSRVRLSTPCDDESDYINASFVQPRGTTRRYIATQGPLDATYRDFWTLVWEQNVRVIVMLTKQYEGGLIKCGQYWKEQQYGDIHLRLEEQTGGDDKPHDSTTGFDFGPAALPQGGEPEASVSIKRVFSVWHEKHPDEAPRRITQIQCVNWPDFDVPDAPEILLDLMHDVDEAVEKTGLSGCGDDRCQFPPVLVHCSAGVGRTGSFILVDAITDGLRREFRERLQRRQPHSGESAGSFPGLVPLSEKSSGSEVKSPPARSKQRTVSFAADATPPTLVLPQPATMSPLAMDVDAEADAPQPMRLDNRQPSSSSTGSSPMYVPRSSSAETSTTPDYEPRPVTQSHVEHYAPTPLSSMDEPIVEVLQAMRVQRMSLVQSLRQYLFVHRAIIVHYLAMLDAERAAGRTASTSAPPSSHPVSATGLRQPEHESSFSSTGSSSTAPTTDDDLKRKSSVTDLQPQTDVRVQLHPDPVETLRSEELEGGGAVNLVKRASFKKRRAANGEDGRGKSVPGSETPSPGMSAVTAGVGGIGVGGKPVLRRGKSSNSSA